MSFRDDLPRPPEHPDWDGFRFWYSIGKTGWIHCRACAVFVGPEKAKKYLEFDPPSTWRAPWEFPRKSQLTRMPSIGKEGSYGYQSFACLSDRSRNTTLIANWIAEKLDGLTLWRVLDTKVRRMECRPVIGCDPDRGAIIAIMPIDPKLAAEHVKP